MSSRTSRNRWIALCSVLVAAATQAAAPPAAWEPTRPVEYLVPAGAGAALDTAARVVKNALESRRVVKQSILVVNKVGGGGALMTAYLDERAGDGHILATIAPTLLTSRVTGQLKKTYSDYTPLAVLFNDYVVVSVRADSPFKDARGLMEHLKSGKSVSLGVAAALGNHVHIAAALAAKAVGADPALLRGVAYKSSTESLTGLMSGDLDVVASTTSNVVPLMGAGKVRVLAISSAKRLGGVFADVPTWKEQGINVELTASQGVMGPKGMTAEQVRYWEQALQTLQQSPDYLAALERFHWTPNFMGAQEARRFYDEQFRTWRQVLQELGMDKAQ